MAAKNLITKAFYALASGDGYYYTAWADGSKPGLNPVIYYTDFVAGPLIGGENGKGAYLSIYGKNFGNFADYLNGTNHVFIGGSEVDNYRCLVPAVGSGLNDHRGVYETHGLMELRVQIGSLGLPAYGTALNITMSVKGRGLGNRNTAGQYYDLVSGAALTFTPQPGPIIFVDAVHGSDTTGTGSFSNPYQSLQGSTAFTGPLTCGHSSTDTAGTKPGTHIYLRGGTYTPKGTTSTGNGGFWANLFRISGTAPTGATNMGPIGISSYPGAAGANSPEKAQYIASAGINASGGFLGNDQARSSATGETCPWDGNRGWGRYMHFSDLKIVCAPDAPRDGAPFNLNSSGDNWRVVNNEGSWNSTTTGVNGAKAAGAAGNGINVYLVGNWFHDINGDTSANQNHGFYIDGSAACAFNVWVAFNCVNNIGAGNGVQTFNLQASGSIQNVYVHSNWIDTVQKHGLNCSDDTSKAYFWNNVVIDAGEAGFHVNASQITTTNGVQLFNNLFYGWGRVLMGRSGIWNDGGVGTGGSVYYKYNIFVQKTGTNYAGSPFIIVDSVGGSQNVIGTNCYFDENGVLANPTATDTTGIFADPKWVNKAQKDFHLVFGSPCINAAGTPPTTRYNDFDGFVFLDTPDVGPFEYGSHL